MKHSGANVFAKDPREMPLPGRRRSRQRFWIAIGTACLGFVALEGFARFGLGLGDPPLSVADPQIEYLFKPGRYRRFGNVIRVNSHHMRSEELSPTKADAAELRVLVFGDSVINGGALTDQQHLATERIRSQLSTATGRPVRVGNISAGSWGPGNLLAYARKFGLFDADVVILVLNSGDIGDNPTGRNVVGIDPNFPDRSPFSAIQEAITRYCFPRLRAMLKTSAPSMQSSEKLDVEAAEKRQSLSDLGDLLALIRQKSIPVAMIFSPQRPEALGWDSSGAKAIREFAAENSLHLIDLTECFGEAIAQGKNPYRAGDQIHPNQYGQGLLAEAMTEAVLESLKQLERSERASSQQQ